MTKERVYRAARSAAAVVLVFMIMLALTLLVQPPTRKRGVDQYKDDDGRVIICTDSGSCHYEDGGGFLP